jgi:hypothetical protein
MTDAPGAAEQTGRKAFLMEMDMPYCGSPTVVN